MIFIDFHWFSWIFCQVPTAPLVAPLLLLDDKPLEVRHRSITGRQRHGAMAPSLCQVESFEEAPAVQRCPGHGAFGIWCPACPHPKQCLKQCRRELVVLPDQPRWKPSVAPVQIQLCWFLLGMDLEQNFTKYFEPVQDEPECEGCEAWN